MPKKEKVFTMPVIALILLSFALGKIGRAHV